MHNGDDHNFIDGGDIENAEGKPLQETTADVLLYFRSSFWTGGDCGNRSFYFSEKFRSQTR